MAAMADEGMFTVMKVRDRITCYVDVGRYLHPRGTVAGPVCED